MDLRERFTRWVEWEIGSYAVPALSQHLRDRGYRLFSYMEHRGHWQREVYHPDRGIFRAGGIDDRDALLAILRQVWLVDSVHGAPAPEVGQ